LVGVYLLGGISGGIFYLLAFNLLPYYQPYAGSYMLGASASALAIAVASATAAPQYKVRLLFFGEVHLQYLVLAYVLMDLLSITSNNQGGHIAHLGGAFSGYLFVKTWQNGTDLTHFFTAIIDFVVNLFRKKTKIKISFENKRFTTEQDYRDRKAAENQIIDTILDKIKRSGYDSLSKEEKKALFDKSQQ
ncbi:MAG: rhomboid family intramembrane serine protease, partial [Prevotellaceae bacterium]|nr:rhomboid family intramembrane serine protease [Prevotellaceae bacterium]